MNSETSNLCEMFGKQNVVVGMRLYNNKGESLGVFVQPMLLITIKRDHRTSTSRFFQIPHKYFNNNVSNEIIELKRCLRFLNTYINIMSLLRNIVNSKISHPMVNIFEKSKIGSSRCFTIIH